MENYLNSPVSVAKSKRELFELSLTASIDRVGIIAAKLEKEIDRLREKVR